MRFGRYGWSYIFLHVGLGVVFLWIGLDMFRHPDAWIGYIPASNPFGISQQVGLQVAGVFDSVLGILLIVRALPRLAALLAAVHLAAILIVYGIDAVLIRDVGLLGAALALFVWPRHYGRRPWWTRIFRRRKHSDEG